MKTITDDIAEIIAKRLLAVFLLIVFLYFFVAAYIGIRDSHEIVKAQAYIADVQKIAGWVESQR